MSLEQRIARLERIVARLLEQSGDGPADRKPSAANESPGAGDVGAQPWSRTRTAEERARESPGGTPDSSAGAGAGAPGAATAGPAPGDGLADQGERWLGRVGVAFVVLAFGFLFKYAFDQGWIGPGFRLILGLMAGTAMLGVGLRLEGERERYSQYLLGGAIAVYYLVGYASYELYALVPFWLAFSFMSTVTVLAFVLAERQRLPSLAVIGAAGGLSTPFLLSTGTTDVPALVAYTTMLLVGAGALQFLRGWRSLLLVLGFGGLAVMGLAAAASSGEPDVLEGLVVVAGILVAWALFGALPLFRTHLRRLDPDAWPDPPPGEAMSQVAPPEQIAMLMLRVGSLIAALVAVLEVGALYEVERATLGWLYGLAFLVYLVMGWRLAKTRLALNPAAETASVLIAVSIAIVLADYRVLFPLAVAAAAMQLADRRWGLPGVAIIAHILFAQLAVLVITHVQILGVMAGSPFGVDELGALAAIVTALSVSFVFASATAKQMYRIAAHVAFLIWLATQFAPMERGQELISLFWGLYGIALLLLSLRLGQKGVQLAGLATLGLVAAKLILVDMAQVDVIWRILLFMFFGAAFLGLSYLINREAKSG